MKCRKVLENSSYLFSDTVDVSDSAALEKHLANCSRCTEKYEDFKRIAGSIESEAVNLEEPDWNRTYSRAIRNSLRQKQQKNGSTSRFLKPALTIIMMLMVFSIGLFFNDLFTISNNPVYRKSVDSLPVVAILDNLEKSRMVLLEYINMDQEGSPERGWGSNNIKLAKRVLIKNRQLSQRYRKLMSEQLLVLMEDLEMLFMEIKNLDEEIDSKFYIEKLMKSRRILLKIERIFLNSRKDSGGKNAFGKDKVFVGSDCSL